VRTLLLRGGLENRCQFTTSILDVECTELVSKHYLHVEIHVCGGTVISLLIGNKVSKER